MKNEKKQNKKENKKLMLFLVILIILVVVIVAIVVIKKGKGENKEISDQKSQGTEQEQTEEQPSQEYTLIDLNNTQNAEVKDGVKQNTSSKLLQERTYKGMTIKDIKLVAEGGITKFTATLENNTKSNYEGETVAIIFKDEDGNEFSRLNTIFPKVDSGKTNEIDASTTADVANAYDFEIK